MKKVILRILLIIASISLILVLCFVYILSQVLSKLPSTIELKPLNYPAWVSVNQKMNRESKVFNRGVDVTKDRTMILTKSEINSMLNMSVRSHNAYYSNSNYTIQNMYFSGKDFVVELYFDLNNNNFLGKYINLKLVFVPEINNGQLVIEVKKMDAGKLVIPSSFINFLISSNSSSINHNNIVKQVTEAVRSFLVINEKVEIIYNPASVIRLLNENRRFGLK